MLTLTLVRSPPFSEGKHGTEKRAPCLRGPSSTARLTRGAGVSLSRTGSTSGSEPGRGNAVALESVAPPQGPTRGRTPGSAPARSSHLQSRTRSWAAGIRAARTGAAPTLVCTLLSNLSFLKLNVFWCLWGLERATLPFWELMARTAVPSCLDGEPGARVSRCQADAPASDPEETRAASAHRPLKAHVTSCKGPSTLLSDPRDPRSSSARQTPDPSPSERRPPKPKPSVKLPLSSQREFPDWPNRGHPSRRRGGETVLPLARLFRNPRLLPTWISLSQRPIPMGAL